MNPELDTDYVYTAFIQKRPHNARIVEVNWDRNPFWNAAMEAERLRSKQDDPDDYDHVWEGVPKSAVAGAIYRREMHLLVTENRIRPLLADPTLGTHAIFDLGINDMMAVTVAQADISGARIVGYHEDSNYGIDHYCEWLKDTGRKDAVIWLPHDGNARSVQTGLTTRRSVENLGWQVEIVPEIGVEPGIKKTRNMLKNAFVSDSPDCAILVEHMRRYTRAKSGHPKHDEHSHCADSVRYTSVAMEHFKNVSERKRNTAEAARNVRIIPTVNHWAKV
jgi:phage terminase large subunit